MLVIIGELHLLMQLPEETVVVKGHRNQIFFSQVPGQGWQQFRVSFTQWPSGGSRVGGQPIEMGNKERTLVLRKHSQVHKLEIDQMLNPTKNHL